MASHVELNPDDNVLGLSLGMKAMRLALTQKTHKVGTVRIPTGGDTDVIIGDGAQDGANRIDRDGNQLPLVDTSGIDKAAQDAQQKADAAAAKADQVRSDLQAEVDKVSAKADDLGKTGDQLAGQITDIKGTVNGQQTKLTEFGQKLEGEITRGDTTVKSVTELKQTVNGLSSTVSQTTKTASAALSKATSVEQTANGLKATISKDYQTTKQADGKYSTKAELSATSDSLSSKITETTKTANGAMDKASSVEQTASGLSVRITEAASEAASAVQTANSLKSTVESNTANITQVGKTADGLVTRTSSLEQNLSGFKSEVSQTYATKTDFDNLSIGGTNLLADSNLIKTYIDPSTGMPSDANASQSDDDWTGDSCTKTPISVSPSTQYTLSAYDDMADATFTGRISQLDSDGNLIGLLVDSITFPGPDHVTFTTAANAASIHVGIYLAPKCKWKLEKGGKPTDWSPAPEDYSTKSYVDQQSKSIALGVVQDYKGADGSGLATKSEVNVSKDNIVLAVQGRYEGDDESLKDIQSSLNITRDKVTIAFSNAEAAAKVGDRLEAYRDSNDTNVGDLSERLDAEIAARQSYIQFGQDANNPVMEMGATSSTARMRLTNTQLQFLVGSVIAAYLSNDQLYINNANVLQTLRIGKYAFVPRSDGHMSLKYVG